MTAMTADGFTAVLGAAGQLGRDLVPLLAAGGADVRGLTRADVDLDRPETVAAYFSANRPAVFVNCAAYNFVDKAEADPAAAYRTNAWGVRALADACHAAGTLFVHFGTDYVFGLETRDEPWRETDAPGPVSEYGRSKLAGEYAARASGPDHLVVRTCGLYGVWGSGGKGTNFIETMLRLADQGKPLRVVADQHCTPTATADLAAAVVALIARGARGLFHVTNAGRTTWHDLAAEAFRLAGVAANLTPITSAEFGAPARRPSTSVLACGKLLAAGVTPPQDWRAALAGYLQARAAKVGRS